MKTNKSIPPRPILRGLVSALAVTALSSYVATAHPYATCLTNSPAGTISFRLNESADTVQVKQGATTVNLGSLGQGLYGPNNLSGSGIVAGQFQVVVDKVGAGTPTLILPTAGTTNNTMFFSPRGVAVNYRAASPYFGRVYVANAGAGTTASGRTTGDGIYMVNADYSDAVGQGNTVLTAGLDMATSGTSMPWRARVGMDDDMLYLCDFGDVTGNLYRTDPNVSGGSGIAMFMAPIGTMASPLNASMNHGSLQEVYVTGSQATSDLKVFSVDEDYETTPGTGTQLNSLWEYDINGGSLPWSTMPDRSVGLASIVQNFSQVMGLDRGPNGYFYLLDSRSTGSEYGLIVIDPAGPAVVWNSLTESINLGSATDLLNVSVSVAVSRDGKYCAVQKSTGVVVLMRMNNGLPDLAGRSTFTAIGTARQIAFDAADNVYVISASTERMRAYSLGLTTTATTTSGTSGSPGPGGAFSLVTPATEVNVTVDTPQIFEAGATTATFTITRVNSPSLASPLAVTFSMTGTATRTNDYVLSTNGVPLWGNIVNIPATQTSVAVTITAVDDTVAELTETAILNIAGAAQYSAGSPQNATVSIVDNDKPMIDISLVQGSMYERLPADYTRFRLTRRGDLNAAAFGANVSVGGGTAAASRYTVPANPVVTFNPGDVTKDFDINPVNDSLLQGNQTFVVTVAAPTTPTDYTVGTNAPLSATGTIVDDEVPAETTVLYSENFNADHSANWKTNFAAFNGIDDFRYIFSYDYASGTPLPAIPAAPHSTADTLGLYMTVNKDEPTALGAAGINTYPVGQSFSGNYAVRFDMYLMVGNAASTTEYALFGIACSGTKTNWFRNTAAPGVGAGWEFDGLWFGVEADGAALGDYVIYSSPTALSASGLYDPTPLTPGVGASTLTGIFKDPPFGGNITPGAPGCTEGSATPSWADVEICKIGRYIRLKIDNTFIMSFTNSVANTNGNIMLGYCDAYDSIMAGNSGVVYDNLRVVRLDLLITAIHIVGANAEVTFTWGVDEATTAFKLQSCATVNGTYADDAGAVITKLSPGIYKATVPTVPAGKFFRVRYAIP